MGEHDKESRSVEDVMTDADREQLDEAREEPVDGKENGDEEKAE
jgi:hypothetical protein